MNVDLWIACFVTWFTYYRGGVPLREFIAGWRCAVKGNVPENAAHYAGSSAYLLWKIETAGKNKDWW